MILSLFARHQINCHIHPYAIISIPTFHYHSYGPWGVLRCLRVKIFGKIETCTIENNVLDIKILLELIDIRDTKNNVSKS